MNICVPCIFTFYCLTPYKRHKILLYSSNFTTFSCISTIGYTFVHAQALEIFLKYIEYNSILKFRGYTYVRTSTSTLLYKFLDKKKESKNPLHCVWVGLEIYATTLPL